MSTIPPEVRDELDQTPQWWNREYRKLLSETYVNAPFAPEEHEGHDIITVDTYGGRRTQFCAQCPTVLVPRDKS